MNHVKSLSPAYDSVNSSINSPIERDTIPPISLDKPYRIHLLNKHVLVCASRSARSLAQLEQRLFTTDYPIVYVVIDDTVEPSHLDVLDTLAINNDKLVVVEKSNKLVEPNYRDALDSIIRQTSILSLELSDIKCAVANSGHAQYFRISNRQIDLIPRLKSTLTVICIIRASSNFTCQQYNALEKTLDTKIDQPLIKIVGFEPEKAMSDEFELDILVFSNNTTHSNLVQLSNGTLEPVNQIDDAPYQSSRPIKCANKKHDYWDHRDAFSEEGYCGECEELKRYN